MAIKIETEKLNANAEDKVGKFSFFTCDEITKKINIFAFEGEFVIVSGNGSKVGHTNYFNGKFNAYQRTYLLSSTNVKKLLNKYLFYFIYANKNILKKESKGSTIPYLTIDNFNWIKNKRWIEISQQQKIIDIIEPLEKKKKINQNIISRIIELIKNIGDSIISTDLKDNKLCLFKQIEEKYDSGLYSQTADIWNFNNKIKKKEYYLVLPSRARIKVEENTLYISKLLGERKILFSNFNNDLIISNDMWGLKSNSSFYFSNLSILFSNYFYSKKKLYSTGITMIGLNDEGLNKIINQTFIRNDIKIENLLKNLFALLSLGAEIEDKLNELINKTVKLLVK